MPIFEVEDCMMSLSEERFQVVEQSLASLRLDFLQTVLDHTRNVSAISKILARQEKDLKDTHHEVTILVGVIGSQGQDIKGMKEHLGIIDQRLDGMNQRLDGMDRRFDGMDQRFDGMGTDIKDIKQTLQQIVSLFGKMG
jgi:archaellum component FlaC